MGLNGGANGSGYAAPTAANITNPTDPNQIAASYGGLQNSLGSQNQLLNALQGQNGLGNQSQIYNQLQGVANGTGPNPAQAMLANATGANVANQAALQAGQRGAGQNVGLIARQAGQQGAATQQNAIGQGAALQAQQSLGALGQAGSLANTQAGQQIGQTNANTAAQLGQQQNLLGAQGNYNNTSVSSQSNLNNANAGLANTAMQGTAGLIGGLGAAAITPAQGAAQGGKIEPVSFAGKHFAMAKGGNVPVILSPGEKYLNPDQAQMIAQDKSKAPQVLSGAKKVPGKAPVKGDSKKNDIFPTKVEVGGVVVPRTKVNVPADAARFIEAALSKKGKK